VPQDTPTDTICFLEQGRLAAAGLQDQSCRANSGGQGAGEGRTADDGCAVGQEGGGAGLFEDSPGDASMRR